MLSFLRVKDELMSDIQFPTAEEAEELLDPEHLLQLGEGKDCQEQVQILLLEPFSKPSV